MINRRGPYTEPCGTPLSTRIHFDMKSPKITRCVRPLRNALIQLSNLSTIPKDGSLMLNIVCATVSML